MSQSNRSVRQADVMHWAKAAFGTEEATSVPQRALRFLEEAIELYQACGGDPERAQLMLNDIFKKPVGEIPQEIGGVSVTLLCLSEAVGADADQCEWAEIDRITALPLEHFRARNAAKNAAGYRAV